MPPSITDTVLGALKVVNLPDNACFEGTSFAELVEKLAQYYAVEVPASITNVVISAQEPNETQLNSLWIRIDNNSDFLGLYIFALGQWRQIFPVPSSVVWLYDSLSTDYLPGPTNKTGYILAWERSGVPTYQKDFLKGKSQFQNNDPSTAVWVIFPVTYVGF